MTAPGQEAQDRAAAVARWKGTLEDIVDLVGEINGPTAPVDPAAREAATGRLAQLLALDDTGEDLDELMETPASLELVRNGHNGDDRGSAADALAPVEHRGGAKPPTASVPAAPGTVIDLDPAPRAPWAGGPGYVAPAQQTVATEMPTSGAELATGRIGFATSGRSFRTYTSRRRGRVRIIWERLITRRQQTRTAAIAFSGVLLVVVAVAGAVMWFVAR